MATFQLDPITWDYVIVNNQLVIIDGRAGIAQNLRQRFQFFLGEWFLDTSLGVPWIQEILVKGPLLQVVQELLKNVVLTCPGVLSLNTFVFNFNRQTRKANIILSASTIDGFINFSQVVNLPLQA